MAAKKGVSLLPSRRPGRARLRLARGGGQSDQTPFALSAGSQERPGSSEGEQQEFLRGGETGAGGREAEGGAGGRGQEASRGVHVRALRRAAWGGLRSHPHLCSDHMTLQRGLHAPGLQRAGDRQKDGGEEAP